MINLIIAGRACIAQGGQEEMNFYSAVAAVGGEGASGVVPAA